LARTARCTASNTRGAGTRGASTQFAASHLIDGDPDTYWSTDDDVHTPEVVLEFPAAIDFNIVRLRECLPLGQRVEQVAIDVAEGEGWREWANVTAIGAQRLVRGPHCRTQRLRLRIVQSPVCPALSELGIFCCHSEA